MGQNRLHHRFRYFEQQSQLMNKVYKIPKYSPEFLDWIRTHVFSHGKYTGRYGEIYDRINQIPARPPICSAGGCNQNPSFWDPLRPGLGRCSRHVTLGERRNFRRLWSMLRVEITYVKLKQAGLVK